MSYIICRFCKYIRIKTYSQSWEYGCCMACRRKLIPDYIPNEQYKMYLDKLNERNIFDRQEKFTEGNS